MKTKFKRFQMADNTSTSFSKNGSGHVVAGKTLRSTHPYLKREFWLVPGNQFWNNAVQTYSSKAKAYFDESLTRM